MSKLIWFILILAIIGGGIYFFSQSGSEEKSFITEQAFVNLIKLEKIKLDSSFFSDPDFSDLQEAPRANVSTITKGRSNPFLSFGRR